jgi:hypothetical protein
MDSVMEKLILTGEFEEVVDDMSVTVGDYAEDSANEGGFIVKILHSSSDGWPIEIHVQKNQSDHANDDIDVYYWYAPNAVWMRNSGPHTYGLGFCRKRL